MSDQTIELVKNVYAAVEQRNMSNLDELLADHVEWNIPGHGPLSGTRRSKREVFEFFEMLGKTVSGTFRVEVHTIMSDGPRAVALVTEHAERNGRTFSVYGAHVWEIKDQHVEKYHHMSSEPYLADEFFS